MTRLSELLGETAKEQLKIRCKTCLNPGWLSVIREFLDGILDGSIPRDTSIGTIHTLLADKYEELDPPVEPYTCALRTFRDHIQRCERDRWRKIQALRASGGHSPNK